MVERDSEAVVAEAEVRHRVPRPGLLRRGGRRGRHGHPRRDPVAREAEADGEEGRLVVVECECERGGGRAAEGRCDDGHAAAVDPLFNGGDSFAFLPM